MGEALTEDARVLLESKRLEPAVIDAERRLASTLGGIEAVFAGR